MNFKHIIWKSCQRATECMLWNWNWAFLTQVNDLSIAAKTAQFWKKSKGIWPTVLSKIWSEINCSSNHIIWKGYQRATVLLLKLDIPNSSYRCSKVFKVLSQDPPEFQTSHQLLSLSHTHTHTHSKANTALQRLIFSSCTPGSSDYSFCSDQNDSLLGSASKETFTLRVRYRGEIRRYTISKVYYVQ